MESTPKFNISATITENFPKIKKPDDYAVNSSDCKIDITNFDQKLSFQSCVDEYNFWWSLELHKLAWVIV